MYIHFLQNSNILTSVNICHINSTLNLLILISHTNTHNVKMGKEWVERERENKKEMKERKENRRMQRLALARTAPRPLMGADGRSLPGTWNPQLLPPNPSRGECVFSFETRFPLFPSFPFFLFFVRI